MNFEVDFWNFFQSPIRAKRCTADICACWWESKGHVVFVPMVRKTSTKTNVQDAKTLLPDQKLVFARMAANAITVRMAIRFVVANPNGLGLDALRPDQGPSLAVLQWIVRVFFLIFRVFLSNLWILRILKNFKKVLKSNLQGQKMINFWKNFQKFFDLLETLFDE